MDVWHPAYPAMEYGGLVFLYMGPPESKPPLLPMFDIIDTRQKLMIYTQSGLLKPSKTSGLPQLPAADPGKNDPKD